MSLVQNYLSEPNNSLSTLTKDFNILVGYHKTLPLAVLNYHATKSKKFHSLIEQCRGLVLELDTHTIISSGMPRFYNKCEDHRYDFKGKLRCEHKEDGTLLHFFYYKDQWVLSNRYNFCDDVVNQAISLQTYSELFEEICKESIQEIGKDLDKSITYCLEMCSLTNAIIKIYKEPKIFLLCAFKNTFEIGYDLVKGHHSWIRPTFTILNSKEIPNYLEKHSLEDISFEGIVVVNSSNKRVKIKSKTYRIIHALKYRGWPALNYDTFNYMNTFNLEDKIIQLVSHYRNKFDIKEMYHRIEMFREHGKDYKFLDENHKNEYCALEKIPKTGPKSCDFDEEIDFDQEIDFEQETDFGEEIDFEQETDFGEEIEYRFTLDTQIAKQVPYQDPSAQQPFDSWKVFCYCGQQMPLRRMKCDFPIYKTCHCGSRFDIKSYPTDTYIYICDSCNLTHEAYQFTMKTDADEILTCYQPVGIPCSEKCKNVRLHVHQLINNLIKNHNMKKEKVYELISKLSNKERHLAHIGKFNINECYDLIIKLQNYILSR